MAYLVLALTSKGEGRVIGDHGQRTGKTERLDHKLKPSERWFLKFKPTVTSKRASPVRTT